MMRWPQNASFLNHLEKSKNKKTKQKKKFVTKLISILFHSKCFLIYYVLFGVQAWTPFEG